VPQKLWEEKCKLTDGEGVAGLATGSARAEYLNSIDTFNELRKLQVDLERSGALLIAEKQEHEATKSKLEGVEAKVKLQKPLADIGAAVRIRAIERSKQRTRVDGKPFKSIGVADPKLIKAGNKAAHQAFIVADATLFPLGYVEESSYLSILREIYFSRKWDWRVYSRNQDVTILREVYNMKASISLAEVEKNCPSNQVRRFPTKFSSNLNVSRVLRRLNFVIRSILTERLCRE